MPSSTEEQSSWIELTMPSSTAEQSSPWTRLKGGLKILAGGLSIGFPPATALLSTCGLGLMTYGGAIAAIGWIGTKLKFGGADKIMSEGLDAMTSGALLFVPYVGAALLMADGATNVISGKNKYGLVNCAKVAKNIATGEKGYRFQDFKDWIKKSIYPVKDRREQVKTSSGTKLPESAKDKEATVVKRPDNSPNEPHPKGRGR